VRAFVIFLPNLNNCFSFHVFMNEWKSWKLLVFLKYRRFLRKNSFFKWLLSSYFNFLILYLCNLKGIITINSTRSKFHSSKCQRYTQSRCNWIEPLPQTQIFWFCTFATWCCKPLRFQTLIMWHNIIHSLKYLKSTELSWEKSELIMT